MRLAIFWLRHLRQILGANTSRYKTDFGTPPNAIYEDDLIGEHIPFGDVSFNLMHALDPQQFVGGRPLLDHP